MTRRRLQRILLTALLGLAALLLVAWLAVLASPSREQARIVGRIEALGGRVWYDYEYNDRAARITGQKPDAPSWLIDLVGIDLFHDVVWVQMNGATDEHFAEICRLEELMGLSLDGSRITERSIERIANLQRLQRLSIDGSATTPAAAKIFAELPITTLTLSSPPERGDEVLRALTRSRTLRRLELTGDGFTDAGIVTLSELDSLEYLRVDHYATTGTLQLMGLRPKLKVEVGRPLTQELFRY